jgi:hypothetical protein
MFSEGVNEYQRLLNGEPQLCGSADSNVAFVLSAVVLKGNELITVASAKLSFDGGTICSMEIWRVAGPPKEESSRK